MHSKILNLFTAFFPQGPNVNVNVIIREDGFAGSGLPPTSERGPISRLGGKFPTLPDRQSILPIGGGDGFATVCCKISTVLSVVIMKKISY
jgi:hypothetical protein